MNDSLVKLLLYIEPKISDIQDIRIETKSLRDVQETLNELIDLGTNSYYDILNFYDQDFIIRTIKISQDATINNVDDYLSSSYLLKTNDINIKELPQYKKAITYMEKLFTYLSNLSHKINLEYESLKEKLEKLEILNKYSIILKKNNIYIEDVDEFLLFLNLIEIPIIDKLNILILINEYNVRNYTITNDIILTKDLYLSDVMRVLEKYRDKINNEDKIKQEYEIDSKILFVKKGFKALDEKKEYLINRIANLYNQNKYENIIDYYQELKEIEIYQKEFEKQKVIYNEKYAKNLIFLRKNNKLVINEFLNSCLTKYKGCVYKDLLDIESSSDLILPDYIIDNLPIYLKKEFVVKTVYMFLEQGLVLVLGVLEENQDVNKFIYDNLSYIKRYFQQIDYLKNINERDILLKDINIEDLILTIDLDTLNMNGG